MSFNKGKMASLKAFMALIIVADHMANFYGVTALRWFIEFGAPIVSVFFFISGYGLQVSYTRKGDSYLDSFFSRRFLRVLVPYILATILYCLLLWSPDQVRWKSFTSLFTEGKTILPFSWYVMEILVLYLFFYISSRYFHDAWSLIILLTLVLALMYATFRLQYGNAWWISSLAFPTGILFARWEKRIYALLEDRPARYGLSLILLLSVFFPAYYGGKVLSKYYLWTLCYVVIPLIVALVIARLPVEKLNGKSVSFLAMVSYEIYLCQGIAMGLLREKVFLHHDLLFVLSVYTVTITLAYGIHCLSRWIMAKICVSSTI